MIKKENIFLNLITLLIASLPLQLATGPFLPDLTVSITAIFFLLYSFNKRIFKIYQNFFFLILFVFYIYILTISFFSKNVYLSLSSSLFYIRFIIFSLFVCYIINLNKEFFFRSLFYILTFLILFLLIDSYLQFFTKHNLFGFYKTEQHRLSGIFRDEYILGSFMLKIFPLFLGLLFYFSIFNKINKIFLILFFSIYFSLIIISGERSAIFLLLILILFLLIIPSPIRSLILSILFITILIAIICIIFNPQVYFRLIETTLSGLFQNEQLKIISYVHHDIYMTAYSIFLDNQIFGIAPKMFREYCFLEIYSFRENGCTTHPHNYYLQILLETGIIGFLIIITFLIYLFKKSKSLFMDNLLSYNYKYFNICIILSLLIYLWPIVPTGSFFNNKNSIFIFYLLGIFHYISNKNIKN